MKQGSNNKRPRRGGAPKGNRGPIRNQTFDSNCNGQRVRGSAQQVMEKYLALARDAASAGDRILAENYYQHAEHYFRIANVNGALSNKVQHGNGAHVPPTPAHDQTALDDFFEHEEDAMVAGDGGGRRGQQPQDQRDDGRAAYGDRQPDDGQGLDDAGSGDEQGEERSGRGRRQRTRRVKQAEPVDAPAADGGSQGEQPAEGPSGDADEAAPAAEKPKRARRTKAAAKEGEEGASGDEGQPKPAPRRRRAPARKKASDEGASEEPAGDDRREAVA